MVVPSSGSSDIDGRPRAGADFLTDVEHRRLVALALADHHRAADRQPVEFLAHGVHRDLIGRLLVAAPAKPRGRHRRALGDAHQFHGQRAVENAGGKVLGDGHERYPMACWPVLRGLLSKRRDNGKTLRCFFESETISID